jgi:glycosyltransferase involved in cell wall biosynthesis
VKILFILPEYYPHSGGGISTYYLHYIRALKPYCEKINVIVGSGYTQNDYTFNIDDIDIDYLRPELFKKYQFQFTKFNLFPEFKNNIAAAWAMNEQGGFGEDYDVIECTDFGLGFVPWVLKHNKPVITRLHGSTGQISLHETKKQNNLSDDFTKQTELLLLPVCDGLITHSTANQIFWNKLLAAEMVTKIAPVFSGSVSTPLQLTQRDLFGLVTARIQQWKGPVQLCDALSIIGHENSPQINWTGRDMPFTEKESTGQYLAATFPQIWNKSVVPQPALKNDQIRFMQQKARFGIVPSTWDMFNFSCIEFLAAGTPLICSEGAGASELIEHGKNGFKYADNNPLALAECIKLVNNLDENEYADMCAAAIETVNSKLAAGKLMPLNLSLYKTVIDKFKADEGNIYTNSIFEPSGEVHRIDEILDKQPIKLLLTYLFKRIRSKVS